MLKFIKAGSVQVILLPVLTFEVYNYFICLGENGIYYLQSNASSTCKRQENFDDSTAYKILK